MGALWVKIFGERNTGTNALSQVVASNSASKCLPGTERELDLHAWRRAHRRWVIGDRMREWCFDRIFRGQDPLHSWKHCATNFDDITPFEEVLVVIMVRHPASWVLSLFRNPYQSIGALPPTLERFLDFKWQTNRRERLQRRRLTPLDLYEAKIDSYLSFTDRLSRLGFPFRFVRFEDLVLQQESVFHDLSGELSRPAELFQPLNASTKETDFFRKAAERHPRPQRDRVSRDLDEYRRHYGEERWRKSLAGLEADINRRVDWDRLQRFGYEPLGNVPAPQP